MTHSPDTQWYALHVRSRHEKTVHMQLEAKQQNVFLPLYSMKTKWGGRWKLVSLPLFPGYVFCRFDASDRYAVLATSGVIDVVRFGSDPAPIPGHQIEAVQRIVSSSASAQPYPTLVQGQKVMMTEGPLTGVVGTLTNTENSCRLVVSIELLSRSVSVEINREWIVPAEPVQPWRLGVPASRPASHHHIS